MIWRPSSAAREAAVLPLNYTREPGPVKGGTSVITFVEDPDPNE
jgi:hypothetical protein